MEVGQTQETSEERNLLTITTTLATMMAVGTCRAPPPTPQSLVVDVRQQCVDLDNQDDEEMARKYGTLTPYPIYDFPLFPFSVDEAVDRAVDGAVGLIPFSIVDGNCSLRP